ncbi:MAG: molybdenum cofactor biosynthesis protein MoaE [Cytophagaceae bacterium]|nr:molybdenum cofactor biosynthesis protein MoaE [Cytophagaceae bacterium]
MEKPYLSYLPRVADDIKFITEYPIDMISLLQEIKDPKAGGIVLFSGEVRNHSHSKDVAYLEYEAYIPMAEKIIKNILKEAVESFNLHKAICVHRIGKIEIGESAVAVLTASSHREESYKANRYIIDRVKHEAPIWKKEFFTDGTSEWGHNCKCNHH